MPGLHYAWVIVMAGALVSAITSTLRIAFGIFIDPIRDTFGWTPGLSAVAYAFHYLVLGASSVALGRLSDRIGTRPLLIGGAILFTLALLLTAYISSVWQLYLTFGVLMGLAGAAFLAPLHTLVTRWFWRGLGVALGLVVATQALGPVVLAPALRYLIGVLSWTEAFVLTGIVGGTVAVLCSLLLHDDPAHRGLQPYGAPSQPYPPPQRRPETSTSGEELFVQARRARPFWLLPGVHLLGCVSHAIPLVHVVSLATAAGVPGVTAAAVLGMVSGFSILGRFGMAILAEHIGGRRTLALTLTIQGAGALLLFAAEHQWTLYLFALIFGIGYGGEMVAFPMINREYYHPRVTASMYGYQMFGAGVGMAVGGILGGLLYDWTGGYGAAISLAALAGFGGVALILALRPPAEEMPLRAGPAATASR